MPTKNADVLTRVASRNVDLVLSEKIPAAEVRAAVENKTIMAAHGKARWNRYGDIIAYSNHVHNHNRECIAAAIVVVNCSPAYANPDAFAKDLVRPRFNMPRVVAATVKIFEDIPLRTNPDEPNDQPEAIAVLVVDYDGHKPARLVGSELAPQPGNPVHYDNFVARICDLIYTCDGLVRGDIGAKLARSRLLSFRCRACSHVRVDLNGRKEIGCAIC